MAEKSNPNKSTEEISLRDILLKLREWIHFLAGQWKWILLFAVIGVVCGLSHALMTKPVYTATISFVTDTRSQGSSTMGLYSGLAAQFGFNLGGGGSGNSLFSGGNIFDVMKTRRILQRTLLSPVEIDGKKTLLIDQYIKVQELGKKNPSLAKMSFTDPPGVPDSFAFSTSQNAAIKSICGDILQNLKYTSGSIMSISFTAKGELLAQAFVEALIQNVSQFYIATKTQKAREDVMVLQKQLDSVKNQLYGAMSNVAAFQDVNQNLVRQEPRVQQQKSSMKVSINSAIYQQLVTGLESAKMTLQKETPLFEIIDKPVLPLDKKQPGKLKWGMAGAILGIFLSAGWFLLHRIYKEIMTSAD